MNASKTDKGTRHFTREELACRHCGKMEMSRETLQKLEQLRGHFGEPMVISSGYRCPVHNQAVSTTGIFGPHVLGRAVDVLVYGPDAYRVIDLAIAAGFTGIGIKQKGPYDGRFIHLDDITGSERHPRPRIWTY
jgi:uncharacterized protein YcbK (DUF882 family)